MEANFNEQSDPCPFFKTSKTYKQVVEEMTIAVNCRKRVKVILDILKSSHLGTLLTLNIQPLSSWVILNACCYLFLKSSFRNIIKVSNSLDPDLARKFVGPDLGLNCLQRFSAEDKKSLLARKLLVIFVM